MISIRAIRLAAVAKVLKPTLQRLDRQREGVISTLVDLAVMAVEATTVCAELGASFDRIWRAPAAASNSGIFSWLRVRLLSLGMVLGIGFLLMVSLIVSAALSSLSRWATRWFGQNVLFAASTLNVVVSLLFVMALFAMLYKWLSHVHLAWRDVWIGVAATAILFTAGKWLIGPYIGRCGVSSVFGAAASLVVLMLWVYLAAQIFLFGAEITSVYAHRRGSLRDWSPPSEQEQQLPK